MNRYRRVVPSTILAFSLVLLVASGGALGADEDDWIVEGNWAVQSIPDPMTVHPAWGAVSESVAPEVPLGRRFRDIESNVVVFCSGEERVVALEFDPGRPTLPRTRAAAIEGGLGELVKLFGLDRLVWVRTRWDDVTKQMLLARDPGESYLTFVNAQEAIRLLKRANILLVELPWETEETSYFRYSLTGSRAAIERVEQGCEAERALQEQIARDARQLDKERLAVLDAGRIEYIAQIKNKIERNWLRPPGTAAGLKCIVRLSQIPGGEVVQAEIRESSGNIAFDRSVEEAVLRSSPLPVPKDPSLFDRNIVITFEPEG